MGCASSKQQQKKKVCRNCKGPFFPPSRSSSMHVHHPPEWEGDSYHVVGVTSSTLGSIKLDDESEKQKLNGGNDFSMAVVEAKTWSELLEKKVPKILPRTPIRTPPGDPEAINAWELMEGLDDITPLRPAHQYRSFSFHNIPSRPDSPEIAEKESNLTSTFRKSLEELSPSNPFHLGSEDVKKNSGKDRVVLYFTSLRGVRKTYEDCCYVRETLKGLGVRIDERDVSMHSGFKDELKELVHEDQDFKGMITLPRVFVGNNHIGGADEIRRMHEDGELEKEVESCERVDGSGSDGGGVCEACGDVRFVPCDRCSGSCKIYCENENEDEDQDEEERDDNDKENDEEEEEEEDGDEKDYGFQRCPDCNENGLVRCPICCG